ncbi:hypothetical protein LY78DRAFT_684064 [Colletotrichum sublineola]|nr:hypothetical protein LY78DRAFT_684064 [Colletotrichum sublineola]
MPRLEGRTTETQFNGISLGDPMPRLTYKPGQERLMARYIVQHGLTPTSAKAAGNPAELFARMGCVGPLHARFTQQRILEAVERRTRRFWSLKQYQPRWDRRDDLSSEVAEDIWRYPDFMQKWLESDWDGDMDPPDSDTNSDNNSDKSGGGAAASRGPVVILHGSGVDDGMATPPQTPVIGLDLFEILSLDPHSAVFNRGAHAHGKGGLVTVKDNCRAKDVILDAIMKQVESNLDGSRKDESAVALRRIVVDTGRLLMDVKVRRMYIDGFVPIKERSQRREKTEDWLGEVCSNF